MFAFDEIHRSDLRIIVGIFEEEHARNVLCLVSILCSPIACRVALLFLHIASFPDFLYCKQQKLGRGLGISNYIESGTVL